MLTVDAAGLCPEGSDAALLLVEVRPPATADLGGRHAGSSPAPRCRPTRCGWCRVTHSSAEHLMTRAGLVDVIIPRGAAGLISSVVNNSTVRY